MVIKNVLFVHENYYYLIMIIFLLQSNAKERTVYKNIIIHLYKYRNIQIYR